MRIAWTGARWLGAQCLDWLAQQPGITITAAWVPATHDRWWTDIDDDATRTKHSIPLRHPATFASLRPDLTISVLNSYIFTPADLDAYPAINLHPAPLPEYRGCNGYAHAILNADTTYRVTLHYIDAGIDTGPIIQDKALPILDDDTGRTLYDRAQHAALDLFKQAMPAVLEAHARGSRAPSRAQDPALARYYPRTSLQDKRTHPLDTRRIRALHFPPWPPADLDPTRPAPAQPAQRTAA